MRVRLALCAVLALAGCGDGEPLAQSAREWTALAPATLSRTEVAAARVGRSVYVMGGFEETSGATTAATERYDIVADRWTRVADMPLALNHAAATAYRGRVYVVGGYRGRGSLSDPIAALFRYDPGADRWTRLASPPTERAALAVGALRGRLYAAGGAREGQALTTLEVYDVRRDRWLRGPGMGVAREHLAGAVADGRFYALAGRAAGRGNFRVVEAFDPGDGSWHRVPGMRKPRGGIAAATVGGRIVVVGGEEGAGTIR
jgi:N-acetylneuraminic acid mutarotase